MSRTEAMLPATAFRDRQIEMAHGAGGKASRRLVEELIVPLLCESSAGLSSVLRIVSTCW